MGQEIARSQFSPEDFQQFRERLGQETALLAETDAAGSVHYLEQARQVKLLTLPGEMGDRFQAIALTRNLDIPLRGFAFRDERGRL